jgi:hypothetical protein
MNLRALSVIDLPRPAPGNPAGDDIRARSVVDRLISQLKDQEQAGLILDSMHPVASINAASAQAATPNNLLYTAASEVADELFGGDDQSRRLVGRTMEQFLAGVQKRMHPAQWRAFEYNQKIARSKLKLRASNKDETQSIATVPIVFENHENPDYNHRAFLPIIVQDYRAREGLNWYNLRVLYLNVTTATEKARSKDGEEYYVCRLNPASDKRLDPLKAYEGVRIFLSYRSDNRAKVLSVYNKLALKQCFQLDPILQACERHLRAIGRYEELADDLNRVVKSNRQLAPGSRSPFRAEDVLALLAARGFHDLSFVDSHFDQCATITGQKPGPSA